MIITITGEPGSGKSTLGEMLSDKLGYKRYYMGQIRRDMAKKMGMSLAQYNSYGEEHPETDLDVDNYQKTLGETEDDFIIEGRTSWFLIPQSIKIYIGVDPREGAQRVFNELQTDNKRNEGDDVKSIEEMVESHRDRMESDRYRYKKYYKKDCFDHNNFDFILNTTNLTIAESFEKLYTYILSRKK